MFKKFFKFIKNIFDYIINTTQFISSHLKTNYHDIRDNYDKNLNILIDKFQTEGKDYETSYKLADECLAIRGSTISKYTEFSKLLNFKDSDSIIK